MRSEHLTKLLKAVDTAVWCWAVKTNTIPGRKIKVDWKAAFDELQAAYYDFELSESALTSNVVLSRDSE
jgi:hypothetical protein